MLDNINVIGVFLFELREIDHKGDQKILAIHLILLIGEALRKTAGDSRRLFIRLEGDSETEHRVHSALRKTDGACDRGTDNVAAFGIIAGMTGNGEAAYTIPVGLKDCCGHQPTIFSIWTFV